MCGYLCFMMMTAWLSWNKRFMTHPILLINELRFEQEVWVSCHNHHVLELEQEETEIVAQEMKNNKTGSTESLIYFSSN